MQVKKMLEDKRDIKAIYWDDDASCLEVGKHNIEKIVCYGEPAEFCHIPYLAVYSDGVILQRIRATNVRILYKSQEVES